MGAEANSGSSMAAIFQHDAISVQQTMRGCIQECFGCEAKSEYRIFGGHIEQGQARQDGIPQIGHLLEESSCLMRCCCGSMRAFSMPLTAGAPGQNGAHGETVVNYKKGCSLPLFFNIPIIIPVVDITTSVTCPCCCMLPAVETVAPDGRILGRSQYLCDIYCLVPKYDVYDKAGNLQYKGTSIHSTFFLTRHALISMLSLPVAAHCFLVKP